MDLLEALVALLALGAFGLAIFIHVALRRRRRGATMGSAPPESKPARSGPRDGSRALVPPASAPRTAMALAALGAEEARKVLPPVLPGGLEAKVCRVCLREFRTALSICPFDRSRLVSKSQVPTPHRRDDYVDTRRALTRCPACDRHRHRGFPPRLRGRWAPSPVRLLAPPDARSEAHVRGPDSRRIS